MNFFESQDRARKKTKVLVAYFAAAVLLTVAAVNAAVFLLASYGGLYAGGPAGWLERPYWAFVTAGTALVILGGSAVRIAKLGDGGRAVARMVGARRVMPDTTDPAERVLINVVEEMAIASGVPSPEVFVMDSEQGINAFVAGYRPAGTVMVVTAGALGSFSRDELQGVVGHEFSHIFNGDMRLNVRLIGILAGILAIGQVGQFILRSFRSGSRIGSGRGGRGGKGGGGGFVIGVGLALFVTGYLGLFFGRLIKAAVSRQREFLADASSVQYTRNPSGIAWALAKIMGAGGGSLLTGRHAEDMSHMCFGESVSFVLSGLFATHPPLPERIRAIAPAVLAEVEKRPGGPKAASRPGRREVPAAGPAESAVAAAGGGAAGRTVAIGASGLSGLAGRPTPAHMDYASSLHRSIPAELRNVLHTTWGARGVVYLLLLPEDGALRDRAVGLIQEREGADITGLARRYGERIRALGPGIKLPLLDITLPALGLLDAEAKARLLETAGLLTGLDKKTTFFEFTLLSLLGKYLGDNAGAPDRVRYRSLRPLAYEVGVLFSAIAQAGGAGPEGAAFACRESTAKLGIGAAHVVGVAEDPLPGLDAALRKLAGLAPELKGRLLDAAAGCVLRDGRVTVEEGELLRAVGASLDCPVPPLLRV